MGRKTMRNVSEEERLAKNAKIREHGKETREKHSTWKLCIVECKLNEKSFSKLQSEQLQMQFVEAKWLWNDWIGRTDKQSQNYNEQFNTTKEKWQYRPLANQKVQVMTKDKTFEERACSYIGTQIAQDVINTLRSNIKSLSTLKKKGLQAPGNIKYTSEITSLNLRQYGVTYSFPSQKKIKIQGIKKHFRIRGLEQKMYKILVWKEFKNGNIDFANAKLVHKPTGYYVQITAFIKPEIIPAKENKIHKALGIDFGCSCSFTTSEAKYIDVKIEESEHLKMLQKKLARQQKGSNSRTKTIQLIRREYQKQTNVKNEKAKQIVAKFKQYETVVIQDEQLRDWHKNGHGKAVQHSILGRVKSDLLRQSNTVVLSKTLPTTKLCTKCGIWHNKLRIWNRTFKCDCGVEMERDLHAAKNMLWFYENNIGVERAKFKRVEIEALVKATLSHSEPTSPEKLENIRL